MRIRDKEIFVLFVIGFTFVFILLCSGYASISNWLWQYNNQVISYEHTEEFYIHSKNSYYAKYIDFDTLEETGWVETDIEKEEKCLGLCKKDMANMVNILSNQSNTTYISDLYLNVGENSAALGIDIIFSYKDIWYRDLAEGQYPSLGDYSNIYAVIGESLMSNTVMIDGKRCIWIGDMYIEVTGIFENYNAAEEDYSVVVFGGEKLFNSSKACYERLVEYLNGDTILTLMGSQKELTSKEIFENTINKSDNLYLGEPGYELALQMSRQENGISRNIWDYLYNIKSMIICIMVLFSIINCVMLSRVWSARRQKDFLIMRIYGLSNRRIISLVFQELLMMSGIGLILAIIFSIIYISVTDGWRVSEHMVEWLILTLFLGLIITVSVCTVSVYLFINRIKPAQAVRL